MSKTSPLGRCVNGAKAPAVYVETDPSGRYGRLKEILGKGAMKTVYRAFDEALAMEVAWNQVQLCHVLGSPEELQRLYSEVHLLKNLNHDCIIKFHTSWIDIDARTFNFITEMFTSGTLREYRKKYQQVDIHAVKNWARQILRGLAYLHGHDPPVIHRDLKCDNIFVNGHIAQVKIGDLGLAAILRGSQHAHSVIGTPEFMAPELYEEEYDELVDIYSFGMCVLEMLTSEYPYSECSNPAQIYKKVTSGKLPDSFYRIKDVEAQKFVWKCLQIASKRLPARELLLHPFLASDEEELRQAPKVPLQKSTPDGTLEEILPSLLVDPTATTDMTITGNISPEGDTIFLKVQISDKDGRTRNIYFPFDIMDDTAIDVATEMVKELEIGDLEAVEIAEMIEEEITSLIPSWKDWGLSDQVHHLQHSFNYEDDEDGGTHHPFYSNSSHSSSHPSLWTLNSCFDNDITSGHDWLQGEHFINDDESSKSSINSGFSYPSGNEDYIDASPRGFQEPLCYPKLRKCTKFCPPNSHCAQQYKKGKLQMESWECGTSNPQRKLSKIRSLVDMRSQLLHQSLVAMINKRRLFKTVGAVENIGFHEPGLPDNDEKQGFQW